MENKFLNILTNAQKASESSIDAEDSKKVIEHFKRLITENESLIVQANQIDVQNNNGKHIDFNKIEAIFEDILADNSLVEIKENINIIDDSLMVSKVYSKKGIVSVLYNGDPYIFIHCSLMGILTHNIVILSQGNYSNGLNNLLLQFIQTALSQFNYDKNVVQINYDNLDALFEAFASINFTIIIGNREMQIKYLKSCNTNTLCSGYDNYDIYVDDESHIEFLKQLLFENSNLTIYLNKNINFKCENSIYVNDINEAVFQINYNGSKYCALIFTSSNENATKFLTGINFSNVLINTNPYIFSKIDINQRELLMEKTIALPKSTNINTIVANKNE